MKNVIRIVPALFAIGAGALIGVWLVRLPVVHQVAGRSFQRGQLIALVGQSGVFEEDLRARLREKQFCAGREDSNDAERIALRHELIARDALPTDDAATNDSERPLVTLRYHYV